MRISSVRVQNYKSVRDSGDIALSPGFNVIVGKNDSGKSALVEALSLSHGSKPHRSALTAPHARSQLPPQSTTQMSVTFSAEELSEFLSQVEALWVPMTDGDAQGALKRFNQLRAADELFNAVWADGASQRAWLGSDVEPTPTSIALIRNRAYPGGVEFAVAGETGHGQSSLASAITSLFRPAIYAFRAERMNVGECGSSGASVLSPNASNLAEVLNHLSSANPPRYERLMTHVRTIFPHITQVTAPIVSSSTPRVLLWSVPIESERADLAVPLAESGTGIGQVLAILYVVVTSDSPRVIIIDEPQSFLHPGAVRKLLEILRAYSQHQYVITTHAPIALATTENDCLLLTRRVEQETRVERIDPRNEEDLRSFLAEVGARLGDVFGADSILWVEGKTEEICFPELIRRLAGKPLSGVQVLGVVSTDELTARMATRVFDIYQRLSGGTSLLPPALAFVFDTEGRTEREREDLDRKSGGLVSWLPRRMYENYLLDPLALCAVFNEEDPNRPKAAVPAEIQGWLEREGTDPKYHRPFEINKYGTDEWYERVHGGLLLKDLFCALSDQRARYDKVRHGLMLTRLLIDQPTVALQQLAAMLSGFVPG